METPEYEAHIATLDFYKSETIPMPIYYCLGLAGESGELIDKVKKTFRDASGVLSPEAKRGMLLEAGDTLWYLTRIVSFLGSSLSEVMSMNIAKLEDRKSRGVQHGAGDNR